RSTIDQTTVRELEFEDQLHTLLISEIYGDLITKARLFKSGTDALGNSYIEPVHETFLQSWSLLNKWLDQKGEGTTEQTNIILHRELTEDAIRYHTQISSSGKKALLWKTNPHLDDVLKFKPGRLNKLESTFVRDSILAKNRDRKTS